MSLIEKINQTIETLRVPFLLPGQIGHNVMPSPEEQLAGEQASFSLRYIATVGAPLFLGDGFPELVAWVWDGWDEMVTHALLEAVAQRPQEVWPLNTPVTGLLPDNRPVMFVEVHPDNYSGLVDPIVAMHTNVWGRPEPKFLQVIFSDEQGNLPGQKGVHQLAEWSQPLLNFPWKSIKPSSREFGTPTPDPLAATAAAAAAAPELATEASEEALEPVPTLEPTEPTEPTEP